MPAIRNGFRAVAAGLMKDQPACLIDFKGTERWELSGKPHRDDGPAIIWPDGYKWWYQHGKRHRIDGSAYIGKDGVELVSKRSKALHNWPCRCIF